MSTGSRTSCVAWRAAPFVCSLAISPSRSPLALEVLSARPYAYLDDAPLEERRTQAVMSRRWLDPESAADIGRLDLAAIERVREEAWPDGTTADELHDSLCWLGFMTDDEVRRNAAWPGLMRDLAAQKRVAQARIVIGGAASADGAREQGAHADGQRLWVAAERRPLVEAVHPGATFEPDIEVPREYAKAWSRDDALIELVRGRLEGLGPVTVSTLAESFSLPASQIASALASLQAEGFAMRGQFTQGVAGEEWCERRLLARIHRYTVKRLRAEIEPVQARDFLRFLLEWQRVTPSARMQGPDALAAILSQLEGFEAPAGAWETEILPARINEYEPAWLDEQSLSGRFVWTRLSKRAAHPDRGAAPVRSTPIVLLPRRNVRLWSAFADAPEAGHLSSKALAVVEVIQTQGASFFDEIVDATRMLPAQVEEAIAELVALGILNSDSFGGLARVAVAVGAAAAASGGSPRSASCAVRDGGLRSMGPGEAADDQRAA